MGTKKKLKQIFRERVDKRNCWLVLSVEVRYENIVVSPAGVAYGESLVTVSNRKKIKKSQKKHSSEYLGSLGTGFTAGSAFATCERTRADLQRFVILRGPLSSDLLSTRCRWLQRQLPDRSRRFSRS